MQKDRSHELSYNGDYNFKTTLRSLPLTQPKQSAWPAIQKQLAEAKAEKPQHRWFAGFAIAATVCLSILTVYFYQNGLYGLYKNDIKQLAGLIEYSQLLEKELQLIDTNTNIYAGDQAAAMAELEDSIALVDLQLLNSNVKQHNINLWQQRVNLMQNLIVMHDTQFNTVSYETQF